MAWKSLQSHRLGQLEPLAGSVFTGYAQLRSQSVTFRAFSDP